MFFNQYINKFSKNNMYFRGTVTSLIIKINLQIIIVEKFEINNEILKFSYFYRSAKTNLYS